MINVFDTHPIIFSNSVLTDEFKLNFACELSLDLIIWLLIIEGVYCFYKAVRSSCLRIMCLHLDFNG